MSIIYNHRIISLLSAGLLVSILGACKELDDISSKFPDDSTTPETQQPNDNPDHSHLVPIDKYQEQAMLNIEGIKINGAPVVIDLAQSDDPWGKSNNKPVVFDGDKINKLEFDFSNRGAADASIYYIEFYLRSLTSMQSINVSIGNISMSNGEMIMSPDTYLNVNVEDYPFGGYGYSYYDSESLISSVVSMEQNKLTLDYSQIMSNVKEVGVDGLAIHNHDTAGMTGTDSSAGVAVSPDGTVFSDRFFAQDLFSVAMYYDGEMYYKNTPVHRLSNCVFTSVDTPPVDISDICQAYLSIFK